MPHLEDDHIAEWDGVVPERWKVGFWCFKFGVMESSLYAIRVYNLYIVLIISVNRTTAYVCMYIDLATYREALRVNYLGQLSELLRNRRLYR